MVAVSQVYSMVHVSETWIPDIEPLNHNLERPGASKRYDFIHASSVLKQVFLVASFLQSLLI